MSDWSQLECDLIVQDYMSMYEKEMRGEKYSKAEHRRGLQPKLEDRSEGSIEFKHQNISAVLIESGYPYIRGYKPASNYQSLLREVVESYVSKNEKHVIAYSEELIGTAAGNYEVDDWSKILTKAPDLLPAHGTNKVRQFKPMQYNYSEREARNQKLGKNGEEFVLHYEKCRLANAGRKDLAMEVEWTSQEKGDGTGYDIRSFDEEKDGELFIEVKTTNSGKYQPFFISDNEVAFSDIYFKQYALYRVFQFRDSPRLFILPGNIEKNVHLETTTYRATF